MEVDIMESSKPEALKVKQEDEPDATEVKQEDDPHATESSSSFGDSLESGTDDIPSTNDVEVESRLGFDNDDFGFDGLETNLLFPPRKKKLTSHWRNFIRPLMWRCKWAELKMKEIQSQVSKYDKELAELEQMKKMEQDQSKVPGFASKLLPWTSSSSSSMPHRKIMKRRKRKRVEESADIKSYMSRHSLFSYLENKNSNSDEEFFCKPEQHDIAHSELRNMNDEWLFHNSKDNLEPILMKIESIQSRLRKLKSGLAVVISENTFIISSSDEFSLRIPSEAQTSCTRKPTCTDDFIMAENCHGIAVPDIIESTDALLSSVDVTTHQAQVKDTSESIMDNAQLHNQVAFDSGESSKKILKKETTETGSIEPTTNSCSRNAKEPKGVGAGLDPEVSFPKAKRKRGDRKPGVGHGWNK